MKPEPIVCCPLDSTVYCSFFLILLSTLMYTAPDPSSYTYFMGKYILNIRVDSTIRKRYISSDDRRC